MGRTLREFLRAGTTRSHDRLDQRLGALIENGAPHYAEFLRIQLSARRSLEAWLAAHGGLNTPPPQTALIARDLSALGAALPSRYAPFAPASGVDPLGMHWVLAGSSLGNRAILSRLRKDSRTLPVAFLSDTRMPDYWRSLRAKLERPADQGDEAVLAGAKAVFAHFHAAADAHLALEAA